MLNSPMNPAGKVFCARRTGTAREVSHERFDALAICDEVYEHLTFDGLKHAPLATLARHVRTLRARRLGRKDVLADRLEGRLGRRPRRT